MRTTEGKIVEWHYQFNGREFEQTLGDSEGQGSLACCSPWVCKKLDMTYQLKDNKHYSECFCELKRKLESQKACSLPIKIFAGF